MTSWLDTKDKIDVLNDGDIVNVIMFGEEKHNFTIIKSEDDKVLFKGKRTVYPPEMITFFAVINS